MRKSIITALISIFFYGIAMGSAMAHAPTWFIVTAYSTFAIVLAGAYIFKFKEDMADIRAELAKKEEESRKKYSGIL